MLATAALKATSFTTRPDELVGNNETDVNHPATLLDPG